MYGSARTTIFCPSSEDSIVQPDAAVAPTNERADLSYERFTVNPATPGFESIFNDVLIVLPALPVAFATDTPKPSDTGACVTGGVVPFPVTFTLPFTKFGEHTITCLSSPTRPCIVFPSPTESKLRLYVPVGVLSFTLSVIVA